MSTPRVHSVTSRGASGTSESFTVSLWVPRDHNRITLLAAQIPKTYYLVNEGYNSFEWSNAPGTTFYIPPGNYTYTTFATMFNAVCPNVTVATDGKDTSDPYSAPSFSTTRDGLYRLRATLSGTLTFPADSELPDILGFDGPTIGVIPSAAGQYLTSTKVIDLSATSQIYISCDKAVSVTMSEGERPGTLTHFFVNQMPDLSFVTFTNPSPIDTARELFNEATVDPTPRQVFTQFSITGNSYAPINLHGHHVDLSIMTYCEHDYWTLFKYYVQAQALQMQIQLASGN